MKTVAVPVLIDSLVNRMAVRSVFSVRNAIKLETGISVKDWEEWFDQPRNVAVRLADRLACAEDCIRRKVNWTGYRRLLREMESEINI